MKIGTRTVWFDISFGHFLAGVSIVLLYVSCGDAGPMERYAGRVIG